MTDLASVVADLHPGQAVTVTVHPYRRSSYDIVGVLVEDAGALTLGGWEVVRDVSGQPSSYLRAVTVHAEPVVIDQPCVVWDMAEGLYHSGPTAVESLSQSGAKLLLPPSSPARYRWQADHGRPPSAEFDMGHAAHALVLGVGSPIVEVDADSWRTKAAQQARDEARAEGATPLLTATAQAVRDMAGALTSHPLAAQLLAGGTPEVSMFGQDPETGVWLRGRVDWVTADGTMVDYKTTACAHPDKFVRSVADYGYHMQAAWYLDLAASLDDMPDADRFLFIAQDKTPPYSVSVVDLDAEWMALGRAANRRAIDMFAACLASGSWPAYGDDIATLTPPYWMRTRSDDTYTTGDSNAELLAELERIMS